MHRDCSRRSFLRPSRLCQRLANEVGQPTGDQDSGRKKQEMKSRFRRGISIERLHRPAEVPDPRATSSECLPSERGGKRRGEGPEFLQGVNRVGKRRGRGGTAVDNGPMLLPSVRPAEALQEIDRLPMASN